MASAEAEAAPSPSELPPPDDILFGLTTEQHAKAQEKYGLNEIHVPGTPLYMLFLHQFIGFLPLLIELAALVSLGIGDYVDFGIIAAMLLVNACLGFHEEYKAKKSLDELSKELESEIACRRNGETIQVNVKELVPGDIVLLVGGTVSRLLIVLIHVQCVFRELIFA
jgi:H+-transporting ATPase